MTLNEKQKALCEGHDFDFSDLKALFINCTLKRSPDFSHTEALMKVSQEIMEANGVGIEMLRAADLTLPAGVYPDMREHGFERDDWPELSRKVMDSNILVVGTPIWLGEESSVCRVLIERLYSESGNLNGKNQSVYYGRTGGCLITGNEDGIKHCAMSILYALQHLGYTIPPQADAGWIGEAGPGPSYADEDSGGPENDFTQRNTTFMTWNLMHTARMLKDAGGLPAHGNDRKAWSAGCRFSHPNPDYRA
ncbi:MAG: flavodoxin family protein [Wenzhouxiangellaceae bacterium]|nr:flavodoxin family protein [Wenzhouxiangellaceae bacterium]MBS3746721.1 flavodoxin family protein [Wenzhouxiangellaceae bacterium]MBS3823655.1 flavodoxin family protein [Wenzhouxiangellaceae bacterium]